MWACKCESFILSFHSEISSNNSFLGYFTDKVWHEQDGIIAKDLWKSKVIFWGDIFVDVPVADLKFPINLRYGYHQRENTGSRLFTEVKPCWTGLTSGWVTILIKYPVLYSLGSQDGVVDINHAVHLYYTVVCVCVWSRIFSSHHPPSTTLDPGGLLHCCVCVVMCCVWIVVNLRVSSGHSGFLPPQNWLLV